MRPIFRATAVLGSSSAVTVVVGLASAKAYALLVGPEGLGFLGLLQSLLGLASLVAGMGVGVGLVRQGAAALAAGDERQVAALCRAIWLLFWALSGGALLGLFLLREPLSLFMLGSDEHVGSVMLMGVATVFSLASGVQTSILNAFHRIGALAKTAATSSALAALVSISLVWRWGELGIPAAIIATTVLQWLISRYFLRKEVGLPQGRPSLDAVMQAAGRLLRFGAPYTASMLVGYGVQLTLPVLVLHQLGQESVGLYRAAAAISLTYLAFLLKAMAQDYYPRVSAASHDAAELNSLVNQQHRLIMLLGVPMILGTLALAPYLVPLIYSVEFLPAVAVLKWHLVGDLLKFSSWTMAYVILARSGSSVYFLSEFVAGMALLVTAWAGMRLFGLAGLGVSYLVTYVVYYALVFVLVRREIGLSWSAWNLGSLGVALVTALGILALPMIGLERFSLPVALLAAAGASLVSAHHIRQELRGRPEALRS